VVGTQIWFEISYVQHIVRILDSLRTLALFVTSHPHADRHAGDISLTVSQEFCEGYLHHGLTQGDEI